MNFNKTVSEQMKASDQLKGYIGVRNKREKFENLYKTEKIVFEKYLTECKAVLDVGCMYGGLSLALKKFNVKYYGIDTDRKAIQYGKKYFKNINLYHDNFLNPKKKYPKCDFVFSLNVFDHYKNWKQVLRAYKKLTNKYICFTTNLKLDGETNLDKDVSFFNYFRTAETILWTVHNIFELVAYLSSYAIGSKSIYIYAYHKYHKENWNTAALSVMPIDPRKLLVGSVVVEIDKNFGKKNTVELHRPSVEIFIDESQFFKSSW
jgi:2-polyprenyl-3-methyl-5-hydroxy-6-metoxy-1,4-benzoquinol methylase